MVLMNRCEQLLRGAPRILIEIKWRFGQISTKIITTIKRIRRVYVRQCNQIIIIYTAKSFY